jgi:hypothetical protein
MRRSSGHKARPKNGKALAIAAALLCAAALSQPNPAYAGPHGGGGVGDSTVAGLAVGFTAVGFTAADLAASMAGDLMDFRAASPVCTMASACDTTVSSGAWGSVSTDIPTAGITIRTTATMTTANPTPRKPGTIVPTLQATTRM